jgi:hypothetical protein
MMEFCKTIGDLKDVILTQDMVADKAKPVSENVAPPDTVEVVGHGRAVTAATIPKRWPIRPEPKKKEPSRDDYEKEKEEADGVRVAGDEGSGEVLPAEESKGR